LYTYTGAAKVYLNVVRVLLEVHADVNQTNYEGITPLVAASSLHKLEVVRWLVKAGADTQMHCYNNPRNAATFHSRAAGASTEQTAYLEAKTHCSSLGCTGAGITKCTGCKQARYTCVMCQKEHWKAHKADCRRWSVELATGKGH
jgi:hypothetical protein